MRQSSALIRFEVDVKQSENVKHGLIFPDIASLILMLMIPPLPLPEGRPQTHEPCKALAAVVYRTTGSRSPIMEYSTHLSSSFSTQILSSGITAQRDYQTRGKLARLY